MGRLQAIILAIFLLVPTGVHAEWTMFGKDANHSGVSDITERTIQDKEPVISWDKGDSSSDEEVYSWGSVIGNFTSNIGGDPYDRDVLHVVYITTEMVDDELRGKLIIWDGGNQKLMWEKDLGLIKDQNDQTIDNDFTSFDSAYATPAIADFDGDGLMDISIIKPNGEVHFYEPEIQYYSDNENYDANDNSQFWSYDSDLTVVRSNPVVTSLNGGNDLIFSGIDLDTDEINVISIDGSNGNRLWQFIASGSEISSPVILEDASNRKIFVSVYDNGNLKVYGIQNGDVLSDWNGMVIASILDPDDPAHHPMLPSIVIADITEDTGKEILVPQPPSSSGEDAQLWLFESDGTPATGWDNSYNLEGGGDMDATPVVGDIDGDLDGDLEIVAVTWSDVGWEDTEKTHVWSIHHDHSFDWLRTYDTTNSGTGDNDEHAISSPILAVIYDDDGSSNLDVFTCTTPDCYALDGHDGENGNPEDSKDRLWDITLYNRGSDNRIFNSPAASDIDGDGLLDIVIDGSVYSANLADLTLKRKDIKITDTEENSVTEVEENQLVVFYPITIRNEGNFQATNVDIEVRLDSKDGNILHEQTINIDANTVKNLEEFNWTAQGQGIHNIWVLCLIDSNKNEEVRYDNNNMSTLLLVRPQYGLELNITDNLETVDVNEPASFIFDLTNVGLQEDNYTISVSVMNPEWTITHPSTINGLASNTTVNFTVNFVPEANVTAAEHLFTITVTSEGNISRIDSEIVSILVNQYYGLKLEIPLTHQRAFPGTEITYPVRIINQGNGMDTFDFFIDNEWGANTWIDNSIKGFVSIGAFRTVDLELRLTTPSDGNVDDYKEVNLSIVSQGNGSITESVTSNTSIGIMMAEKAVVGVLPGEKASFSVIFLNPTNITASFNVSIILGAPDWEYSIFPENVTLDTDEVGNSWINFTAPNTATPGDSFVIQLGFGNGEILDIITVVLEVNTIQGIRLWSIEDKHVAYSDPGETVYFNVRVVNYEDQELTIDLFHQSDFIPGWSVAYNTLSTWSKTIPGGSSTTVNISVTPPEDAESVDTGWLRIIGTTNDFVPTYFDVNITVNQEFGISISSKDTITLLGNISELVKISVTNSGNGPDIFEVKYSGAWVQNTTDLISFDGFETKEISISVSPGLIAPGTQETVLLEINSTKSFDTDQIVSDNYTLSFVVTGIKMVGTPLLNLNQGDTDSFGVLIVSLLNQDSNSRMITEVTGAAQSWVSFNDTIEFCDGNNCDETYVVSVGSPELFFVDVIIPQNVESGVYNFTLIVKDYYNVSHISTLTHTLTVIQEYDISMIATDVPTFSNPGYNAEWALQVSNNGNGPDTIIMDVTGMPDFWSYSFHSDSIINLESTFLSPNIKLFILTLYIPDNATSGDYNFVIAAQSLGDTVNLDANLTVNPIYKISASAIGERELTGEPGDVVYFQFEVVNLGNSNDSVQISATGTMLSQATPNDFGWINESFNPSVSESNYLKATVPLSNDGPWTAIVSISSVGNPSISTTLKFTLNGFTLPDAGIRDLVLTPINPKPDDKVTARFTITAADAQIESVYYTVYLDGDVIGGDRVFGLEKGGSKVITFSFIVTEGSHVFSVKLDEESELDETNMGNNIAQQEFVVESSNSSNLALYLIVFAVLSVSIAVYYRYSRRDQSEVSTVSVRKSPVISEVSINFPLVLNCLQCGSRVRIARPGSFRCPSCKEVSDVDSNGEIKSSSDTSETQVKNRKESSSVSSQSNRTRSSRMEAFLSEKRSEESPKKVISEKLSASERLKHLKEEINIDDSSEDSESEIKTTDDVKSVDESDDETDSDKPKKRKDPPKGGSFGPTVGGF